MYEHRQPSRQAPGIFTYMEFFSSKILAYSIFFGAPIFFGLVSMLFNAYYLGVWALDVMLIKFIEIFSIFMVISIGGTLFTLIFYSKDSPILILPPNGWVIQLNAFFSTVIGGTFVFGEIISLLFNNTAFQEIFFMLGCILSYIFAFVIYFSFTTVGKYGHLLLALAQPVAAIILYSLWTAQTSLDFFIRAIIFFCTCAFLFALPYGRKLFHVSNVYKEVTGLGGYSFIRAFVLSMLTEGHDDRIESVFNKVGVDSNVKLQYLLIRSENNKKLKGLFFVPHIHFGPFKTCGSSDLPEHIYTTFNDIPGTTVYHTTNTHTQNLTTQTEVKKILNKIKEDIDKIRNDKTLKWGKEVVDFSRKISNSAKLIGMVVNNVPIVFFTRHPLPSDDIQSGVGEEIRNLAKAEGFQEIIAIDAHNSIIGDEILILKDSIEANDIIDVSKKFLINNKWENTAKTPLLYGVAKDQINKYSEKDGIGSGGIVVHLFKNTLNNQKTILIHFDGNNAYVEIRSFILNMLQNRGIEKGEISTSDSHTVARQFTSRGYSPIGDKIKMEFILKKLENLIIIAERNLEPVEFYYGESIQENVRIWGDIKYFDAVIKTLEECIQVSERLLTLSLIIPTFFSLILLLFYYNIPIL